MFELALRLVDGGKLNSDQSLQQFNIKKKIYAKSFRQRTFSISLLNS